MAPRIWWCTKVFAGREKDWLDVEGVASRQGSRLNRRLVAVELHPLLELKIAKWVVRSATPPADCRS
ncbi:MAG: hypothetical protein ACRDRH_11330 [Pseudonocardia sp.]